MVALRNDLKQPCHEKTPENVTKERFSWNFFDEKASRYHLKYPKNPGTQPKYASKAFAISVH